MFTGIVETLGVIERAETRAGGLFVEIAHDLSAEPLAAGESICVSGCCLTALEPRPGRFAADLSPETVERTGGADAWRIGRRLNLERALRATDRLGGHIVQGHVDGGAELLAIEPQGDASAVYRFSLPAEGSPLVVEKGSIAVDGVSLTIADLGEDWFTVALIPETLRRTTLGLNEGGERVNIEYDVLAKYALRALRVVTERIR